MTVSKQQTPGQEENNVTLSVEQVFDTETGPIDLDDIFNTGDYTLSLQSNFENNLISEFKAEWIFYYNFSEMELANIEGIIPKRYDVEATDDDSIYYIYGLSTSDDISRPSFDILDRSENNFFNTDNLQVNYDNLELSSLENIYKKQDLSDSIKERVGAISANIFAKMNLNIDQNLNFQKSKSKKIDSKKVSIFEKQTKAPSIETSSNTSTATSTAQRTGTY